MIESFRFNAIIDFFNAFPRFKDLSSSETDSPEATRPVDRNISRKSLAQFVIDNNGVMHVPNANCYVVNGHNDAKYCVTLHPEFCACPSMSRCYHILAVKMFVCVPFIDDNKEVIFRSLSTRKLKKVIRNPAENVQEQTM